MADYTYWQVGETTDTIIRRSDDGTDILTDGAWVAINPDDFGGSIDPWAGKIGDGEAVQLTEDEALKAGA